MADVSPVEFFDISQLLDRNVQILVLQDADFIPLDETGLSDDFWMVENAGIENSLVADVDVWPPLLYV